MGNLLATPEQETFALPSGADAAFLTSARRAIAVLGGREAPAGQAEVAVGEGATDGFTAVLQAAIPFRPITAV